MIVAITGGRGFIGRALARKHLEAGDRVRILSRRPGRMDAAQWFAGDLADSAGDLRDFVQGADVLYHCAGEIRDRTAMEKVHVGGARRLIEAARGRIGRWVQLSSVGVYGPRMEGRITEETLPAPVGIYERTKYAADQRVLAAFAEGAFEATILRPSIVFGPEMPNQSLFALISAIERGIFFYIGPPGASANYIDVDNVVAALRLAATHPAANGEVFNLSDWRTMEQFVGTICACLGRPRPWLRLPRWPLQVATNCLHFAAPRIPLTPARVNALSSRATYPIDNIICTLNYLYVNSMESSIDLLVSSWKAKKAASADRAARPLETLSSGGIHLA